MASNSSKEIEALEITKVELLTEKQNLETQVSQTGERLEALQDTEARLLKARDEYRKTQESHAGMAAALAAITAQRDATITHATELEQQIGELRQLRAQLERELTGYQSRHQEIKREFEEYQGGAETSRRDLEAALQRLEEQSASLHSRNETLSRQFAEVQSRHADLAGQNRDLEAALRRLDEITDNIRKSEWTVKELDGRRKSLESACADAQNQMRKVTESHSTLARNIEQLETRRSAVQKELQSLTVNERIERARYEEMRALNADAESLAAGQRAKYEEAMEAMRQESSLLEARLTRARTWNDDLDKLYAKLAAMPEGSPEANQFWAEIQRRKQAIAEQVPAGVQIRPGGRGQIVPRGRR
jgi:chromosome segregation ATPase